MPDSFTKDPAAVLDYSVSWASWMAPGDAVDTFAWTVPEELEIVREDRNGAVATVWLSGGVVGAKHVVTCRVVTTAGRTDERSIKITIKQR